MCIKEYLILIFTLFFSVAPYTQTKAQETQESYALSLADKVAETQRFLSNSSELADPAVQASLPVGIIKEINNVRYIIAIDSVVFLPDRAWFNAYMAVELPGSKRRIAFGARHVSINPKGVQPGNGSRLQLLSEQRLSFGPQLEMTLAPNGRNFIEWDCNGFKGINLNGDFEIAPGLLVPADRSNRPVKASFDTYMSSIHDFVVQVGIEPFQLSSIQDMTFTVTDVIADFSETRTFPGMLLPKGYNNPNMLSYDMWTGFYLKNLTVQLPKELSRNSQPIKLLANNMIIDNSGLSGQVEGINLIGLQEGSMSGWAFSVDKLGIDILQNHVNGGQLQGQVQLPITDQGPMKYEALVSENPSNKEIDYLFAISPGNDIQLNFLPATVQIEKTSQISVAKRDGKFWPKAILDGNVSFSHGNLNTPKLRFETLTIVTDHPYVTNGYIALSNKKEKSTGANFPLTLDSVVLVLSPTGPAVGFYAGLNFVDKDPTDSSGGDFSAKVGIFAQAKIRQTTIVPGTESAPVYNTKWTFQKVYVNDITLDAKTSALTLKGIIKFRDNDPVYGKGFFGQIDFNVNLEATSMGFGLTACFGRVNEYRYWYVDGYAEVPVALGPVKIIRWYGGASYHMKRNAAMVDFTKYPEQLFSTQPNSYVPDINAGIGLKAGVTVCPSAGSNAVNADVLLEILFNSPEHGGGLNNISLKGAVYFLTAYEDRKNSPAKGKKAYGTIEVTYDHENQTFHAGCSVSINYEKIYGSGSVVLHFDPKDWYLWIGKPSSRVIVGVQHIGQFNSYFMVGTQLEPPPAVPAEVQDIVSGYNLNNQRNQDQLKDAKGCVFGAGVNIAFGGEFGWDFFSVFYNVNAGAGFDAMIVKLGPNAHCSGGSEQPGMNGWFMSGQIYAYAQGSVGAKGEVGVWGVNTKFDVTIFDVGAAAILQARGPNPFFVSGLVAGYYNILGVVKGDLQFEFKSGEYCQLM